MSDEVISAQQVQATPAGYQVPAAQSILVKSVRAVVDGTGAGAAFLATLQLVSPDGRVVWESAQDTAIAAGGSADASWFPGVAAAAAVTPPSSVAMTYAWAKVNGWTWTQPGSTAVDFTGGTFFRSSTTDYTLNVAANVPIEVETPGLYFVFLQVGRWNPAWGATPRISLANLTTWQFNSDTSTMKRPQMGPTYDPAGIGGAYLSTSVVFVNQPPVVPEQLSLAVSQQSGADRVQNASMFVVKWTPL